VEHHVRYKTDYLSEHTNESTAYVKVQFIPHREHVLPLEKPGDECFVRKNILFAARIYGMHNYTVDKIPGFFFFIVEPGGT
jgi:hypothetical protein